MRLLSILVVAVALLLPATAGADNGQIFDRHDVHGLLDIAAVTQAHTDGAVVHTVRTHRAFPSRALRGGNGIVVMLDTNGDPRIDRLVLVLYVGGALRAVVADEHARGAPPGIDCPTTCTASYRRGAGVTLQATPADGWMFAGWSGACTGTGACTVTMPNAESVTATFVPVYTLTVSTFGPGYVG